MTFTQMFANVKHLARTNRGLDKLPDTDLKQHLKWYWDHGTIFWHEDWKGRLTGLCLFKVFDDLKDMDDFYVHVPHGQFFMIEHFTAPGRKVMKKLFGDVCSVWGQPRFILWDRQERTQKGARMYTWQQFVKLARRITRNG